MTEEYMKACATLAEMAAAEEENRELEAAYREAAAYYSSLYSYNFGSVGW